LFRWLGVCRRAYGETVRNRGLRETRMGRSFLLSGLRARVSSWPPLRLVRLRRERVSEAHAQIAYGGALRRAGRRSEARQPLRHAVEIALATGARAVARAAHEELVASGAKPRRLRQSGAEGNDRLGRRDLFHGHVFPDPDSWSSARPPT
jgi:hypothetical protein